MMPTYGAELSKVSNAYDKFRQMVGGVPGNGRLFGRKIWLEPVAAALGRSVILRPDIEI